MALKKKGKYQYGDNQQDIRHVLVGYSKKNAYVASHFADAICVCGCPLFRLSLDEQAGVAVRTCKTCEAAHAIGDSQDYLSGAKLEECGCPCGSEFFEITAGVALYPNSEDVKWLYLGCRCPECHLVACYGDWKNEFLGYQELLNRI